MSVSGGLFHLRWTDCQRHGYTSCPPGSSLMVRFFVRSEPLSGTTVAVIARPLAVIAPS